MHKKTIYKKNFVKQLMWILIVLICFVGIKNYIIPEIIENQPKWYDYKSQSQGKHEQLAEKISSIIDEEQDDVLDYIKKTLRITEKTEIDGDVELNKKLRERLSYNNQYRTIFLNNMMQLIDLKIDHVLIGSQLEKYIKKNYNITINKYLKMDDDGNVIDTNGFTLVDYIIKEQKVSLIIYYLNSQSSSITDIERIYNILIESIDISIIRLKRIPQLFQRGIIKAQVEKIGAFHPVPGNYINGDIYEFKGKLDEFFAFVLAIIIVVILTNPKKTILQAKIIYKKIYCFLQKKY